MRERHVLTVLVVVAGAVLANCSSAPADDVAAQGAAIAVVPRLIVTLKLTAYGAQMEALAARYDVAGVDIHTSEVDVVVAADALDQLRRDGFDVVRVKREDELAPDPDLSRYLRPDTLATALRGYVERHPTIAAVTTIGRSNEGRDILAMRITKDVGAPHSPDKPTILFNAMHHARELMTSEAALDTIDVLLEKYGTDARVTHWVDANEIWVVPMLNVDGSNQVWTHDKLWRKNTRGCPASGTCPRGTGVDINRNYPYNFAACNGSSASASSDSFHGAGPGSEPETQAMVGLVNRTRPVLDLSYHSYSELVLYPYGCRGVHAPTEAVLADIGKKMASVLPSDDGVHTYRAGTPWEILYGVDGDDIDWMLHDFAVVPFAIELSSSRAGFQPSYSLWRDKTVTKARAAWQLLLDRLDGSAVRGVARSSGGATLHDAEVDVVSATTPSANQSRVVNPDGSFHIVLLPGQYDVTVNAVGQHRPFTRHVTVGEARVDLDVVLD